MDTNWSNANDVPVQERQLDSGEISLEVGDEASGRYLTFTITPVLPENRDPTIPIGKDEAIWTLWKNPPDTVEESGSPEGTAIRNNVSYGEAMRIAKEYVYQLEEQE